MLAVSSVSYTHLLALGAQKSYVKKDDNTPIVPKCGEFTFALIDAATGQEIDRTTNAGIAFTFKAISYLSLIHI